MRAVGTLLILSLGVAVCSAQSPGSAQSARSEAPIDLTGTWVSVVNEDWRWRMITPPHGDYASVPLNGNGRRVADQWNVAQDGSCKAYGAAALMRMPIRVRITWESGNVLKLESDSGEQVRRFYFAGAPTRAPRTLQGVSVANWERPPPKGDGFGFGPGAAPAPGGSLTVTTTNLSSAWLRRNGVPYSENARLTEYYDRFSSPDGSEWFVVTTVIDDPEYLVAPFVTSSQFRREADGSRWTPRPCRADD